MNLDMPIRDARRIEVVCYGLPLWHSAHLAVDATLVSPLSRDGRPHPGTETLPGAAVRTAARRKQANLPRARPWQAVPPGRVWARGWRPLERRSRLLLPPARASRRDIGQMLARGATELRQKPCCLQIVQSGDALQKFMRWAHGTG